MRRAGLSHLSFLALRTKGIRRQEEYLVISHTGSKRLPRERETALSAGITSCFIWGLFHSYLQHATNTSISLVITHANKLLFILAYFCKHILQIWKIKVGTNEGKMVLFFQSEQDSISFFLFCSCFCPLLASFHFMLPAVHITNHQKGTGAICRVIIWWRWMWSWMCWKWNLNKLQWVSLPQCITHMAPEYLSNCEDYPPFTSDCLCICLELEMSRLQSHIFPFF